MKITIETDLDTMVTVEDKDVQTWMEATPMFFNALRGLGYVIMFDNDSAVEALADMHDEARYGSL